jgi:FG-GAP-like repeat
VRAPAVRVLLLSAAILVSSTVGYAGTMPPSRRSEPNDSPQLAERLSPNGETTWTLGAADEDWFVFPAGANHRVGVILTAHTVNGRWPDLIIELYDPNMQLVDYRNGAGGELAAYAPSAGDYRVRIAPHSSHKGAVSYELATGSRPYVSSDPTYSPPITFPKRLYDADWRDGPWGESSTVADFTGDGRRDVFMSASARVNTTQWRFFLYRQRSDGLLARPQSWRFSPAGNVPSWALRYGVAAGDLDGDRKADVAAARGQGIDLFYQRRGGLDDPKLLRTPFAADDVIIADLNGTRRNELVVDSSRGVLVYRRGNRGWQKSRPVSLRLDIVRVGDVTGDGRPDLVGTRHFDQIRIYPQRPGGKFGDAIVLRVEGDDSPLSGSIALGDFTGDGRRDIAAWASGQSGQIDIFPQTANGFGPPKIWTAPDHWSFSDAGDVNDDGRLELVGSRVIYFLDADGDVVRHLFYEGGGDVTIADVTGDDAVDIVGADPYGLEVSPGGFTP